MIRFDTRLDGRDGRDLRKVLVINLVIHVTLACLLACSLNIIFFGIENVQERWLRMIIVASVTTSLLSLPTSWFSYQMVSRLSLERLRFQVEAKTDHLTGLPNRRALMNRAQRDQLGNVSKGAFIIADIDNFKGVNDRWGHDTGDLALRTIAQALRANVRDENLLCRWGGEEFAIYLPGETLDQAQTLAERLRRVVEHQSVLATDAQQRITLTASFGVAGSCAEPVNINDLYAAADKALYVAKSNGRNRVEVADQHAKEPKVA